MPGTELQRTPHYRISSIRYLFGLDALGNQDKLR